MSIVGQEVKTPTACSCGSEFAVVGAGDGRYYATLTCSCGRSRGALTEFTANWIETLASKFGSPATITLRRVVAS